MICPQAQESKQGRIEELRPQASEKESLKGTEARSFQCALRQPLMSTYNAYGPDLSPGNPFPSKEVLTIGSIVPQLTRASDRLRILEGSSKVSKPKKNKEPIVKLKPVAEEVVKQTVPIKIRKGVLKRTKKITTKKYEGSSKFETSTIVTSIALLPPQTFIIPPTSTTPFSPTFDIMMQEPITTLFSSQFTESKNSISEDEAYNNDMMVSFVEMQFNPEEDDVLDEESCLSQESRMRTLIEDVYKRIDENLKNNSRTSNFEISKLHDVSNEFHELFEKMVSSSQEYFELKLKELNDFL
ncbi:unnamed protein product [Lactuca saligna]|uniref:Uncharacterized protein n=1 Tax=Lactuca saligna TaxID=75948 RepID=A0AA36EHN7_LACSI|nr:unnamed protein product [Lactuca saligna]